MLKKLLVDSTGMSFYISDLSGTQETHRKLKSFIDFEEGWSYGYGKRFDIEILEKAISFHSALVNTGLLKTDAFPGLNGEIMVTGYHHDHYLEFIFEPDQTVTFTHEKADDEVFYQEGLSIQQALQHLREFKSRWMQYEFLIKDTIMTEQGEGSTASHSRILGQEIPVSPSSAQSVYLNREDPSVNIFESTMRGLLGNHLFFGSSQQKYYRLSTS